MLMPDVYGTTVSFYILYRGNVIKDFTAAYGIRLEQALSAVLESRYSRLPLASPRRPSHRHSFSQ